jgi:sporulation protein YlmC with PRC-barrel domain
MMPTPPKNAQGGPQAIRDLMDSLLMTHDGVRIGRVADLEAVWDADGSLRLTHLLCGPQALAGRLRPQLRRLARWLLRDHFEQRIPVEEITEIGPTVRLRGVASDYRVGASERWFVEHIIQHIPGAASER